MARIGITYEDVEKAALQLQGRGKLPTVDRIRELLGTGSKTTITEHLKRWKAEQADSQGKLPQELSALVTGLWERLQAQAEQRVSELRSIYDEQIKELQQTLAKNQQEANQLKQELHEAVERGLRFANEKQTLEQQQQIQQQMQIQLETRYAVSQQQVEDLKTDNARLHQLANQVQANLEHYQQAMQSLRAEQAREIEKRESNFQREIQTLQQTSSTAQKKLTILQEESQRQTYLLQQGEETINMLREQVANLTSQYEQVIQDLTKFKERCTYLEKSLHTRQEEVQHYQAQVKELEKQVTILSEQRQQLSNSLRQAEDKVENLRHEKLFLAQEKAELLGSLKQLQKYKTITNES